MSAPRHLLFSVDDTGESMDGHLALAVLSADPTNRIYVGPHHCLMGLARRLKGGVYLGMGARGDRRDQELEDYHLLKQRGFVVVHFDHQGAIYPGGERRWRSILQERLDPRQLDANDYVCTWGNFQRDVYRELDPPCRQNIRTTGHPLFDLYERRWHSYYRSQTNRLRAKFGDFLLINTDLARAHQGHGDDDGESPSPSMQARLHGIDAWAHENETLSHFVRLVHRLHMVFPELALVVRPHRREDPDFYRLVFQGLSSVHVLQDSPVAPWILASQCVIHSGCVAGLGAHLGDAPTINFRPVQNPRQTLFLPDQCGVICDTIDHVVECLVALFHRDQRRTPFDDPPLIDHRAKQLLHNLYDPCIPTLASVLDEAQRQVEHSAALPRLALRTEHRLRDTLAGIRSVLGTFSPPNQGAARRLSSFDGFNATDVSKRIGRLEHLTGRSVDHHVLSPRLLVVESAR